MSRMTTSILSSEGLKSSICDRHRVPLPTAREAGHYKLYVGLYDLTTLQRLPITDADIPVADQSGSRAHIATVEIR